MLSRAATFLHEDARKPKRGTRALESITSSLTEHRTTENDPWTMKLQSEILSQREQRQHAPVTTLVARVKLDVRRVGSQLSLPGVEKTIATYRCDRRRAITYSCASREVLNPKS